jgi:two-component system OmpR family response regulator
MVTILLVEDNDELRRLLRIRLERAGYDVLEAASGEQALEALDRQTVHLMVADIMMPGMSGFELTGELRGAGIEIPVLIISARESLADKREGFRRGADDYLTKPFEAEELLLRIEALLRRSGIAAAGRLRAGEWELDPAALTVSRGEERVALRQKEFQLLYKLLSSPGRIFTRQSLMDEIWGFDSESDPRTVDTHIRRLRERFADVPELEIQTVRGLGYRAAPRKSGAQP